MAPEPATTIQNWNRLRTALRSFEAVVVQQPQYLGSLKPLVEDALRLLSGRPSEQAREELHYLLTRAEESIARWRPDPQSSGTFYIQPEWAASTDRDLQEAFRLLQMLQTTVAAGPSLVAGTEVMKVFVSHSSADKRIAEAFVDFIRAALPIDAKEIRCTSVDGYKLPPGTNSDEQLRREVFDAQSFVALLSPTSITSIYVMFELGARWGSGKYLAPVMVAGLTPAALKPPLSAIHAVAGTSEGDLHQLVETLAEELQLTAEKASVYTSALRRFVTAATAP